MVAELVSIHQSPSEPQSGPSRALKSGSNPTDPTGMLLRPHLASRSSGFSLTEVMIVIGIIGILASIAVPSFLKYQLRAKTAEVRSSIAAIQLAEDAYYAEFGLYLAAAPEPAVLPGARAVPFNDASTVFGTIGYNPEGYVLFSYGVAVASDLTGYTVDAGADIDGNGIVQFWGFAKPDSASAKVAGLVGCDVTKISLSSIEPCGSDYGKSIF